jgi:hypothetical protein
VATTSQPAFFGGLGQAYGNRVSIRAQVLGEESFNDANANGQFDAGEAFTDLTEAFTDDNEDGVFGGQLADGSPSPGASSSTNSKCYGSDLECFQVGGDNEEFFDFNNNGTFDLANNIYNGVLCPESENQKDDSDPTKVCTKELLTVSKNIVLLQAGSVPRIGIIEDGLDRNDANNYFQTTALPARFESLVADLHNGLMPAGTTITWETGNGEIVGPSSCVLGSSNAFNISFCPVSVNPDTESSSGPLTLTVTVPAQGSQSAQSFSRNIIVTD